MLRASRQSFSASELITVADIAGKEGTQIHENSAWELSHVAVDFQHIPRKLNAGFAYGNVITCSRGSRKGKVGSGSAPLGATGQSNPTFHFERRAC